MGNELGMGALKEATERVILYGDTCRCSCGGGIGITSRADAIVFGAVSDDAAYAFLACLAHLLAQPDILHSPEMENRVLEAACNRGAVDGLSGLKGSWIDWSAPYRPLNATALSVRGFRRHKNEIRGVYLQNRLRRTHDAS